MSQICWLPTIFGGDHSESTTSTTSGQALRCRGKNLSQGEDREEELPNNIVDYHDRGGQGVRLRTVSETPTEDVEFRRLFLADQWVRGQDARRTAPRVPNGALGQCVGATLSIRAAPHVAGLCSMGEQGRRNPATARCRDSADGGQHRREC